DTTTWEERGHLDLTKAGAGLNLLMAPFSPDGRFFVVYRKFRGKGEQGQPRSETALIDVAAARERAALPGGNPQFSPAGKLLATPRGEEVTLWGCDTAGEVRRRAGGGAVAWRGSWFSPDGRLLLTPTAGGRSKLWETATGKEIATLEGFEPTWSKDSKTLATVLPGPVVKLWDAASGDPQAGAPRATLRGFDQPGRLGQLSPDGRPLLTSVFEYGLKPNGDSDFPGSQRPYKPKKIRIDVRLWEAATGKEIVRLPGSTQFSRGAVFSPDGKTIAYQRLTNEPGYKMEVVLWDVEAGKERLTIRDERGIDGVSFSPDGGTVVGVTGDSPDRAVGFWDAASGRRLAGLPQIHGLITFASSPDGHTLT